jgi:holliday junction DNA helicase RuvA
MIAHVTGTVSRLEANSVVLDVGGVGYRLMVPLGVLSNLPEVGGKATLFTTLVIAANTMELTLYGFARPEEQQVFLLLTSVTGVGPKVALSMLSVLDVADLARAISASDTKSLTKVPGVGPKLAQRICLELGERMAAFLFAARIDQAISPKGAAENEAYEDVVEALVGLGFGRPDSRKAAERAIANAADKANTSGLIKDALNLLTSGGKR